MNCIVCLNKTFYLNQAGFRSARYRLVSIDTRYRLDRLLSIPYRYSWHSFTASICSPSLPQICSVSYLLPQQLLPPLHIFSFIVRNMDSEADSSLLAPSTALDSVSTRLKRGKSAHATWTYTQTAPDGEPESKNRVCLLYCAYCSQESLYSTTVTTNF